MLSTTDKDNILLWADEFFANSVICLNEYLCCGKSTCAIENKMAKVLVLKQSLESVGTYISEEKIDNLYRRLQCLINLKIQD